MTPAPSVNRSAPQVALPSSPLPSPADYAQR